MERSSSPGQDPEQKDSPEAPRRPPDFDDVTMIRDVNQGVLSIADAARAGSTPLAETQRGSTAGTQAAEENGSPAQTPMTPVDSPPGNPFDGNQGSAPTPATPAAFPPYAQAPFDQAMPDQPGGPGSPGRLTTSELGAPSPANSPFLSADNPGSTALPSDDGVMTALLLGVPTWFAQQSDAGRGGHVLRHLTEQGDVVVPVA